MKNHSKIIHLRLISMTFHITLLVIGILIRARLVLGWVTVLVSQLLVIVLRMRLITKAIGVSL